MLDGVVQGQDATFGLGLITHEEGPVLSQADRALWWVNINNYTGKLSLQQSHENGKITLLSWGFCYDESGFLHSICINVQLGTGKSFCYNEDFVMMAFVVIPVDR